MKASALKVFTVTTGRGMNYLLAALCLLLILPAGGQELGGNRRIILRVRDARGAPIGTVPVNLRARVGTYNFSAHTQADGTLAFSGLTAGDYLVEVNVPGYRLALEEVVLPLAFPNIIPNVYIYLQRESDPDESTAASGVPLPDSKAGKDIRKAREKLAKNDLKGAQQHLESAQRAAPSNPEVHYLFGMLHVQRQAPAAAEEHLKKAIALNPRHVPALRALGRLLFQRGDLPETTKCLEAALAVNGGAADDHSLLAEALFQQQQLEKAEFHARQAVELSQGTQPEMRLVLCEILMAKGDNAEAGKLLEAYLREFPTHAAAPVARSVLEKIRRGETPAPRQNEPKASKGGEPGRDLNSFAGNAAASALPAVEGPATPDWGPPDVDADRPAVLHDVPCDLAEVLRRTRETVEDMAANIGDLSAEESVTHTDVGKDGRPEQSESRRFDYTVSIEKAAGGALLFKETRDADASKEALGGFATSALAVMAMVFHPYYAEDFEMRCQGQAIWQGQPVWLIYFRQRADRPARFHGFYSRLGSFRIPLKGRAWIAANSFQIVRLETAMVAPIREARLEREQMVIEYRPVRFEQRQQTFWLPHSADIYMQYRGRRWHRQHVLQNYIHFAVDTRQKISAPEAPPVQPKDPPE